MDAASRGGKGSALVSLSVAVLLLSRGSLDQSCLHNNRWVLEMAEMQDLLKHACSLN